MASHGEAVQLFVETTGAARARLLWLACGLLLCATFAMAIGLRRRLATRSGQARGRANERLCSRDCKSRSTTCSLRRQKEFREQMELLKRQGRAFQSSLQLSFADLDLVRSRRLEVWDESDREGISWSFCSSASRASKTSRASGASGGSCGGSSLGGKLVSGSGGAKGPKDPAAAQVCAAGSCSPCGSPRELPLENMLLRATSSGSDCIDAN
eukprot:Tamp_25131.p1 GENE.Tamp_25131~~Tamp_25131.p1  ORF type:complete len:233 (+),score=36.40 Tamp_25131:64-699(+)